MGGGDEDGREAEGSRGGSPGAWGHGGVAAGMRAMWWLGTCAGLDAGTGRGPAARPGTGRPRCRRDPRDPSNEGRRQGVSGREGQASFPHLAGVTMISYISLLDITYIHINSSDFIYIKNI